MLLEVIEQLVKSQNLEDVEAQALTKAIFRYALKFDAARELKQVASRLDITPAFMEFKRVHLNNSHYILSRLWRAAYSYYCDQRSCDRCVHCIICPEELVCEKFEWDFLALAAEYKVSLEDILYLVKNDVRESKDQKTLKARGKMLAPPNPALINQVLVDSTPYIKYIVYRKLSFIFRYNNLDPIDFINDLTAWALSHLNDSDYISDRDELMKIVTTSVNQMSINLIAQYTAKKRSRLTSTEGGYRSTTISLEMNEHSSLDRYKSPLNEEDLLNRVKTNMTPDEISFLEGRLDGRPKGDLLVQLKWTNKKVTSFKAKMKNLLEMCVI